MFERENFFVRWFLPRSVRKRIKRKRQEALMGDDPDVPPYHYDNYDEFDGYQENDTRDDVTSAAVLLLVSGTLPFLTAFDGAALDDISFVANGLIVVAGSVVVSVAVFQLGASAFKDISERIEYARWYNTEPTAADHAYADYVNLMASSEQDLLEQIEADAYYARQKEIRDSNERDRTDTMYRQIGYYDPDYDAWRATQVLREAQADYFARPQYDNSYEGMDFDRDYNYDYSGGDRYASY